MSDKERFCPGKFVSGEGEHLCWLHFCLGAPLARLEARIALEVLFERLCEIELAPGVPLEATVGPLGYGMKRLPVIFKRK